MSASDVVALLAALGAILGTFGGLRQANKRQQFDTSTTLFQDALGLADRYQKELDTIRQENRLLEAENDRLKAENQELRLKLVVTGKGEANG